MFEPNTIKTLLSMKRGKNNSPADPVATGKSLDASALATNIGFATIQESLDLNNEMDQFLKEHEKWKAEYAEKEKKIHAKPLPPAPKPKPANNESKEQFKKEMMEMSKKCEDNIKELASNKSKMEEMQRIKAEIDKKLALSQKALETKNEVEKLVSPLDELQGQLDFGADELSEVLDAGKAKDSGTDAVKSDKDAKVAKILADLDEDMKELDELLK